MEKILLLCDDQWHPAEVIERGLAAGPDLGYQFDTVKAAKDILTWEMLKEYRAVLSCKGNNVIAANPEPWFEEGVTDAGPAEFRRYVEEGGGFVAVHSANTFVEHLCRPEELFQRPCRQFREWLGNTFLGHPPRCEVRAAVSDPEHPVARGVHPFAVRDEHYQIQVTAPDARIFLTTESETGGVQTAGYTREMGAGRLCVLTPGHTLAVWGHPEFRRLLGNAISWCLREE